MKKLFASDLDGTLLNALHMTDFFILHSIRKVIDSGNYFTVATGRNMRKFQIRKSYKNLPIYCVCMNGARVISPEYDVIFEQPIDKKWVREVLEKFPDLNLECMGRKHAYVRCKKEKFTLSAKKKTWLRKLIECLIDEDILADFVFDVTNEDILKDDIFKINCSIADRDMQKQFEEYIASRKDGIINAPYASGYYELTDVHVNKGRALKILADHLQLSNQQVYVYGDGMNDVNMLQSFQNSFVPKNGCLEAKKAGNFEIGLNTHYSVPRHMINIIQQD